MVFNATFNTIPVILCQSVLLLEYPKKNTALLQVAGKLYCIILNEYISP